ncbi:DUF6392 family protein [Photorhabdus australis]|uniref:DUF6392 family protein n=1 Tax=Photorhabdus australis TaxID=286156 RepID=UPI000B33B78E|nr:DUF6392 family protein [Photorhabdus australis]
MMTDITAIINSLGQTADMLVKSKLIPAGKFEFAFEGSARFSVELEVGLTLVFDSISKQLVSVQFTLINDIDYTGIYVGEMPTPLFHQMDKITVRELMGEPDSNSGPKRIPVIGLIGGFDAYIRKLNDQYPKAEIRFLYRPDLRVHAILFEPLINGD